MFDKLMTTYNPLDVSFERGEGAWLWDTNGKKYLDALSGVAVCALGHAHSAVAEALCKQSQQLLHTSNIYHIPQQEALAEKLTQLAGMDRAFFGNSGAEANEAAIKLARLYGHGKGIDNPTIVVTENSFHGRTLATLTATGNRKVQAGFEPLVHGFVRAPFDDIEALENIAHNNRDVVAILVEPIQGEGGINIPADDYLDRVRTLCSEHGWLMMLDEIQTGMGRSGRWFAYQHKQCRPDVITIAKALGNGVPIGACLARGAAAKVLQPGSHGSTYGGNPLACSAALAVINTLEQENLIDQAETMGNYLLNGLNSTLGDCKQIAQIRGCGMMIGIELTQPCSELVGQALEQGLLINVTAEQVIRLLPPLILERTQADTIIQTLNGLIRAL